LALPWVVCIAPRKPDGEVPSRLSWAQCPMHVAMSLLEVKSTLPHRPL
jgi:hypothetical protein